MFMYHLFVPNWFLQVQHSNLPALHLGTFSDQFVTHQRDFLNSLSRKDYTPILTMVHIDNTLIIHALLMVQHILAVCSMAHWKLFQPSLVTSVSCLIILYNHQLKDLPYSAFSTISHKSSRSRTLCCLLLECKTASGTPSCWVNQNIG